MLFSESADNVGQDSTWMGDHYEIEKVFKSYYLGLDKVSLG